MVANEIKFVTLNIEELSYSSNSKRLKTVKT